MEIGQKIASGEWHSISICCQIQSILAKSAILQFTVDVHFRWVFVVKGISNERNHQHYSIGSNIYKAFRFRIEDGRGIDRFSIASLSRKVKASHSPSEVKRQNHSEMGHHISHFLALHVVDIRGKFRPPDHRCLTNIQGWKLKGSMDIHRRKKKAWESEIEF
eukprot:scaffold33263_cov70-Cyclotella_meneghiniana.AAC.1